ncbi:glycogen debranching protein GlgX [Mycobacterium sp. Y57]|uniref:glycogen debranching protein GlgX n=1 Tax=Mycolicibacterium xanthum TaxID=2796469 RepID=UPI001C84E4EB|nr:glycogen debranching protein GlgX [Mycolicibacterium xanthum]MBX7432643.1 glycogen debranching protein GlgX [Mycolicibacterium xanthum]
MRGPTAGESAPLGATVRAGGVNFSVFSKDATQIDLLLFPGEQSTEPDRVITLDPNRNRTYHYWHTFIPDVGPGQVYAYRAHGPFAPERGLRFDADKVLLDPYGVAVDVPAAYDRDAAVRPGDNAATAMKSVVADLSTYDWEGDAPLRRPASETVIYEMHVRGFTRHPSSGVGADRRGTFAGLVDKIPYLEQLGINAVELLPVFQYDPHDAPQGLVNYWGYQPVSFFAPHHAYASRGGALAVIDEFRDMVKALHRAGIEVILDVVFNHTSEGAHDGPTFCYRGLANDFYYILQQDKSRYADYTGCGNTLNGNQSIVRRMILDSLRHWVADMHVDGFRFDLASILARDESGHPRSSPPVLWDVETDPTLAGTKLIAEAWDAAGLYQVGSFIGDSWVEWNGQFRDDVRRFVKGDRGTVRGLAARLLGSPDIYGRHQREAEKSVNFVTSHDGFTLNDLVSYDRKHNEANREDNRDGSNDNLSWNCGIEGPTDDVDVEALRTRQIKNFLTLTLMAAGLPMILMGDEMRRTQFGNNNAYCQDNETSWLDWTLLERNRDVHRFAANLIPYRTRRFAEGTPLTLDEVLEHSMIEWHGVRLHHPDWADDSHSLAVSLKSLRADMRLHAMSNAYCRPLTFELPSCVPAGSESARWRRWIDTALPSPADIGQWRTAPPVTDERYTLQPRSVVVLVSHTGASAPPV